MKLGPSASRHTKNKARALLTSTLPLLKLDRISQLTAATVSSRYGNLHNAGRTATSPDSGMPRSLDSCRILLADAGPIAAGSLDLGQQAEGGSQLSRTEQS